MRRSPTGLAVALLLVAGAVLPTVTRAAEEVDPFEGLLFPPELIMKHQTAIGLSAEQRQELITEVTQAQADFLPAQMELAGGAEELKRLVAAPRIDEEAAVAAAVRLMDLETRIKQRHLVLAIRIKNMLSASQQAQLTRLRDERR